MSTMAGSTFRVVRDDDDVFAVVMADDTGYTLRATMPGRSVEIHRSIAAGDFTRADVTLALRGRGEPGLPGARKTTRRYRLTRSWSLYVHLNTGPPTWWRPVVEPRRWGFMAGWLRGMVAVIARHEEPASPTG